MSVGVKEVEITSWRTKKIALLTLVINALESFAGGFGCKDLRYSIRESGVRICYSACEEEVDEGYELDDAVNYGLIKEYSIRKCNEGNKHRKIYEEASNLFIKAVTSYLSTYVARTQAIGIEYMFLVLRNGRGFILEGEKNRVVIPGIKSVASAHTHPEWCLPSPHDVRSWINLLLEGGFGAGIVSPKCRFFLVKTGPFTEEDYIEISRFRGKLSSKDFKKIDEALRAGKIGENLRIYLIV